MGLAVSVAGCGADGTLGSADGPPDAKVASAPTAPDTSGGSDDGGEEPGGSEDDDGGTEAGGNAPGKPSGGRKPPPIPKFAIQAANQLPLAEQVGQLFLVGFPGTDLSSPVFNEVEKHGWGGLSISAANAPTGDLYGLFSGEARARAQNADTVPPLTLAQLDGGPPRLGATRKQGLDRAAEASALSQAAGIDFAIQPRIDVGLGADQQLIRKVAPGAVRGWLKNGVMTAVAHFPGQGTASQDPIDGPATVGLSQEDLAKRDLVPFRSALKTSPAVTVSSAAFSAYDPVNPASLEPSIIRGILRDRFRFKGVAMTDDIASITAATGKSAPVVAVQALNAGIDMVYVPEPGLRGPVYRGVLKAAKSGRLQKARVRDAAARVLVLKRRAGLFTP